jgi:hypothetical protein
VPGTVGRMNSMNFMAYLPEDVGLCVSAHAAPDGGRDGSEEEVLDLSYSFAPFSRSEP